MTVLLDTNVLLDVLLTRQPFAVDSAKVYDACDRGDLTGFVCASSVTDLFYIVHKATQDRARALALVADLCQAVSVAAVNQAVIYEAFRSPLRDFEDAVSAAAANAANLDAIVTRDPAGFQGSAVPIHEPAEIVQICGL